MDAAVVIKSRKRRVRQVTEQRILEAAAYVFTQRGFANATVGEMVERSNLSRGAFYIYFTNKRDVFFALVSRATADLYAIDTISRHDTYRERVRASTHAYLEGFSRNRGIFRCLFEVSTADPEIGALHNKYRKQWAQRMREHFKRNTAVGRFRELDPEALAFCLGGMIGGIAYEWMCGKFDPWPEEPMSMDRLVDQVADMWCRCVFADPADADKLVPAPVAAPATTKPAAKTPKAASKPEKSAAKATAPIAPRKAAMKRAKAA